MHVDHEVVEDVEELANLAEASLVGATEEEAEGDDGEAKLSMDDRLAKMKALRKRMVSLSSVLRFSL